MAFGIARITVKDDIAVDLAECGVGRSKGSQHGTVNGGGAVGPGQSPGKIPQDPTRIFPGGSRAIAEDLVAAVLNNGTIHVDEDGGVQRGDNVDPVKLSPREAASKEVAAIQRKDIQRLIRTC